MAAKMQACFLFAMLARQASLPQERACLLLLLLLLLVLVLVLIIITAHVHQVLPEMIGGPILCPRVYGPLFNPKAQDSWLIPGSIGFLICVRLYDFE